MVVSLLSTETEQCPLYSGTRHHILLLLMIMALRAISALRSTPLSLHLCSDVTDLLSAYRGITWWSAYCHELWSQTFYIPILVLSLSRYVNLNKSLSFSRPPFPYLSTIHNDNTYSLVVLCRLNELTVVVDLEQCPEFTT